MLKLVAVLVFLIGWALFRRRRGPKAPLIYGGIGDEVRGILSAVPSLAYLPSPPLGVGGMVQLFVFFLQTMWEAARFEMMFEFEQEEVPVNLPGESTTGCADRVLVKWLKAVKGKPEKSLPDDAPIVILLPGLNCYAASLPGTSIYKHLWERPWRVVVFEKRGVGPPGKAKPLLAPCFHLFGHPSDLHEVVLRICKRYPKAPLHVVGQSSGNGLAGSYTVMYGDKVPALRSTLLLIAGEDYNLAFRPPKGDWTSRLVYDTALLETTKALFLRRNAAVLRKGSEAGYLACMAATTLQEMYDLTMLFFSGYSDRAEAERLINGFSGSNKCLETVAVPFLVIFTADDPAQPGGPRQEWVDVISKCEKAAMAIYPNGGHLGCYDGWRGARWTDRLAVDWIDAHEAAGSRTSIG